MIEIWNIHELPATFACWGTYSGGRMKGGGEGDEGRQTVRCDRVVIIAAHGRPTIFSELKYYLR